MVGAVAVVGGEDGAHCLLVTAVGGTHYLGVTYHYTDNELSVHSRLLDLIDCDAAATGELSKAMINERIKAHFERS